MYFEFFASEDGDVSFTTYLTKETLIEEVARRVREEGALLDDFVTVEEIIETRYCNPSDDGFGSDGMCLLR